MFICVRNEVVKLLMGGNICHWEFSIVCGMGFIDTVVFDSDFSKRCVSQYNRANAHGTCSQNYKTISRPFSVRYDYSILETYV